MFCVMKRRWKMILTVFFMLCIVILVFRLSILHSVALEQEVRCGLTEHIHTEDCYDEDLLVCTETEHTHDKTCFPVRLEENDLNGLLERLEEEKGHSLENMISDVLQHGENQESQPELIFYENNNEGEPGNTELTGEIEENDTDGEVVLTSKKATFTVKATETVTSVSISYDTDFPTLSGITVSNRPTISGTAAETYSETVTEDSSVTIRNVSRQEVTGKVDGNETDLSRMIHFVGWRVGNSNVILSANTRLTWEEVLNYASDGSMNLTAVWEYDAKQTASFFIRFDSVAVDTEGNISGQDANLYTNELFATHVGGIDLERSVSELNTLYHIADSTSDNSYAADQGIRALAGGQTDGVWLQSFPKDEDIFEQLKSYASHLEVDGEPVDVNDLHDSEYAIRWYVFKAQKDAWHIDGKLVKKVGLFHVYKSFAGNQDLIQKAKDGFYIDAYNEADHIHETLDLNNYASYEAETDTYFWEISKVDHGEEWTITEYPDISSEEMEYSRYSEFIVRDAKNKQSKSGTGTSVSITGSTYALDESMDQVLRIEFTNIYNRKDSIVIRKQDERTGNSLSGATFQLLQNGELLKFRYNSETKRYQLDLENGTYTSLNTDHHGYYEITAEDFSYDEGPITIRELNAPEGYAAIGDIIIGYMDEEEKKIGMIQGDEQLVRYVDGILMVGNSTDMVSVKVKKNWECPKEEWEDITIQLLADGKLISTMISGVEPTAVLTEEDGWTYTWKHLPVYMNGSQIAYSVREIQIGDETCKSDYSFLNWVASYDLPRYSTDEDGNQQMSIQITNTTKRVLLRLTKTDSAMTKQLAGATFLLEAVDSHGQVDTSEVTKTLTTDENGALVFDNLKVGVRYRLTEILEPEGYLKLEEPVYATIREDGSVMVEEHPYAWAGSTSYNIIISNQAAEPLPDTGGSGRWMYGIIAILLTGIATYVYINHIYYKKESKL
ncbi:MAG: collagen binding domain-containing protein [Lachnospiraceae bacterium]